MERSFLGGALLVVAVTVATYLPTLWNALCLDDQLVLTAPFPRSLAEIPHLWAEPVAHGLTLHYRPLSFATFALDHVLWGVSPAGFHVTNLLLASVAGVLALGLARRLLAPGPALFAALLFAVLPGHAEAVVSVYNRSQVLAAVGTFAAVLCLLRALDGTRAGMVWIGLGTLATLLGCFAKESALVTPVLSALVVLHLRPGRALRGRAVLGIALQLVACVGLFALRHHAVDVLLSHRPQSFLDGASPWTRYVNVTRVLTAYFAKAVWPLPLTCDYPWRAVSFHWSALVHPPLWIGAALLLWRGTAPLRLVAFGLFWFLASLLPVLHLVSIHIAFAERLLYPASFGLALLAAGACTRLLGFRPPWVYLLLVLPAAVTFRHTFVWRDDETLWRDTLESTPESYRAHLNVGAYAAKKAIAETDPRRARPLFDEALAYIDDSLDLDPNLDNRVLAHFNRVVIWFNLGEVARATAELERVLELEPAYRRAWIVRGDLAAAAQDWDRALESYGRVPGPVNRWDTTYFEVQEKIAQVRAARR